jgi:hypothetical protein
MNCKTCFEDWICKCVPYSDVITINTNVEAGLYEYKITDKFGAVYQGIAERTVEGKLEIPIADFPDGFWGEFGGAKTLQIYEYGGCNPISIPLALMVDCIDIDVRGGNAEKNTIGCDVL